MWSLKEESISEEKKKAHEQVKLVHSLNMHSITIESFKRPVVLCSNVTYVTSLGQSEFANVISCSKLSIEIFNALNVHSYIAVNV